MALATSSSVAAATVIRLTMTEWPETDVATFFVEILFSLKMALIRRETSGAFMMAPSTTVSGSNVSSPRFSSS